MNKLATVLLFACTVASAQETRNVAADGKFERRTYSIARASSPVVVDGVINDGEWSAAKPVDLAYETSPGNNVPAHVKTLAYLAYDDRNLYVAIRAYDPKPSAIRANLMDRDRAYQDDFAGIAIDTFNDERRAFEFFVNPLGVQMDLTNNDISGNEDDSWDAIWSSAGKIHDDRYEVEMAIPFTQLRFKDTAGPQTWGLDVVRIYPRDRRYRFGLHAQDRNRACYVCQFSKLTGIEGLRPGRNLEVAPTVTAQRTDARTQADPRTVSPLVRGSFDTEPGVTARWGITPNVTLNGAINPDFSQVEADSPQLDINNTFALFFNEKRPFFLEGADFFETPLRVVYTRTVADPDWGAKLTGKEGPHGGGAFVARDTRTDVVIPGSQRSRFAQLSEANLAGVLRYRTDIGRNTNVGLLLTSRSGGDYSNRLGGIDGNFKLTPRDIIQAQLLYSQTEYPDRLARDYAQKTSMSDLAGYFRYRHSTRNWFWQARYEDIGPDFRADSGFIPRVGYSLALAGAERTFYPKDGEKKWWSRWSVGGDYDRTDEKATGRQLEEEYEAYTGVAGPRQSYVSIGVATRDRHYQGRDFNNEVVSNIYAEVTPFKKLYTSLEINLGDQIDFANVRPATRVRVAPYLRYRATRSLELGLSHQVERLNVDGGRLYLANLSELRAVYQFNLRTFVRALLQFTDIERDPSLYRTAVDARSRELFPQLLFSYKLNPQTVLFVGYSSTRLGNESLDLTELDRTLFVKVGYAWAM